MQKVITKCIFFDDHIYEAGKEATIQIYFVDNMPMVISIFLYILFEFQEQIMETTLSLESKLPKKESELQS